ncbi:hypothetical protein EXIGLDRAFT_434082 [Exidia glandulosa HHB12029]|uniref:Uncharacterized protein n=1 Tax=Exidia glandulosa HHB12029 TaxID=1314781 RepID=A0A165B9H8_EXIGL|nr:hypothetical protein EXIGLDRAFT_434082 [Exidia glandulosa HHB12029]
MSEPLNSPRFASTRKTVKSLGQSSPAPLSSATNRPLPVPSSSRTRAPSSSQPLSDRSSHGAAYHASLAQPPLPFNLPPGYRLVPYVITGAAPSSAHTETIDPVHDDNPLAIVPYVPPPSPPDMTVALRPHPAPASAADRHHQPTPPSPPRGLPPLSPGGNPWDKSDDEDEVESPRVTARKNYEFHLYASMRYLETKSMANGKQQSKSAKVTQTIHAKVLQLSRNQFIMLFLKAHDAVALYKVTAEGPPFLISLG